MMVQSNAQRWYDCLHCRSGLFRGADTVGFISLPGGLMEDCLAKDQHIQVSCCHSDGLCGSVCCAISGFTRAHGLKYGLMVGTHVIILHQLTTLFVIIGILPLSRSTGMSSMAIDCQLEDFTSHDARLPLVSRSASRRQEENISHCCVTTEL
eukprot:scaffold311161_cov16-Prasinocladus_malaysianus.AAC.1